MPEGWSRQAADYVDSTAVCPRCGATIEPTLVCGTCRAILSGPEAAQVRAASRRAAEALLERQRLIDLLPVAPVAAAPVMVVAPAAAATPRTPGAQGQIGVSSVLAVVGAALVAVAGLVFTFLNPDLAFGARTAIIAVLTVLFLGASWLMMRRGLRLSAEAVGALGMVFVVLDIWAAVQKTPLELSGWVPAAVGTLLASIVMLTLAVAVRMRVWLWTSIVGLVLVPAMFGYALSNGWAVHAGHVAAGFVAWGAHRLVRRAAGRFGSELRADHGTATTLQLLASGVVGITLPFLPMPDGLHVIGSRVDDAGARVLGAGLILVALAVLAVFGTRDRLPRVWSVLSGVWFALAFAQLAFVPLDDAVPRLTLGPLTTAAALVLLTAIRLPGSVRRRQVLAGATAVAGLAAVPAATASIVELGSAGVMLPSGWGLWATLGLAVAAVGGSATGFLARWRGDASVARAGWISGLWIAAGAILTLAAWAGWSRTAGAVMAIAVALALALLLLVPVVRTTPRWLRTPVLITGHALLLVAGISSWIERPLTVPVGIAIVAVLVALGLASPRVLRPYTLAVGYAYALVIFATGLSRAGVESIAVLCLTASLAAVAGLVATLVPRLRAALWYAVLVVTVVPFLVGVVTVLFVRSGWTALSTGLIFLLALTLLLSRRPGLGRFVRTTAAALLVPALAVVVVCLGAQVLSQSASPVTLPIIAVIVAATLCATAPIATGLARHGLAAADAAAARAAIEASALLTGAIAVLLALVRQAAGLGTTFVVLLVLGIGAAAAAAFAHRRYGWWVAGICWSGALWCALWLAGVQVAEPYVLPPALGLAVVGVVLAARGGTGLPLVATGLACAVLPTLVLIAVVGPGDGILPWRTVGLLVGAVVLLLLSGLAAGRLDRHGRLASLHVPLLVAAIVAAAGAAVQGVRWALGVDALTLPVSTLILPVLGIALLAVAPAAIAAWMLVRRTGRTSRWVLAPAVLYLVAGPIASARDSWLPIWVLWGLAIALLAAVVVVAWRARRGPTVLPPVWFVWAAAWATAVAGWSARELRVELFSLPLGIALLAAGVVGMRPAAGSSDGGLRATPNTWPAGFAGSWRLLTPGIAAVFLPSLLSTGTDPQTWRAILVIALALAAILVGSLFKLGAPFVLGIAVLPIENVVVFAVQIGRSIGSTPWWITLASAGAVLIVIAATWERRTTGDRGGAARLRDLR